MNKLRGMFALALYDIKTRSLLSPATVRDKTPLLRAWDRPIDFASEINALRTCLESRSA